MGYDDLPDLNEDETDCFDVSLACKRFPSIVVGCSPPVSLYDGTSDFFNMRNLLGAKGYEDFFSNSTSEEQMLNILHETLDSPDSTLSSLESSISREPHSCVEPLALESITLVPEEKLDQPVTLEGESLLDEAPVELFLDRGIRCIMGLKKKHYRQLEDSGFHTVCFMRNFGKDEKLV